MAGDTRTLGYDAASRLTSLTDTHNTLSFGYDAIDRLIQVTGGPVDQSFQYDPNGNRTSLTAGTDTTTYTYISGTNRLGSYDGPSPRTYGYDANGSPTGDGVHTYTYDARNRLVAVDGGTTRVRRRISRITRSSGLLVCNDPVISCTGVMMKRGDTCEPGDGRRNKTLDRPPQIGAGHRHPAGKDDGGESQPPV